MIINNAICDKTEKPCHYYLHIMFWLFRFVEDDVGSPVRQPVRTPAGMAPCESVTSVLLSS